MSARGSRFLLPAWASAREARRGQEPGSPHSVPGELRGGLGVLLLPTAPCDCARAPRPGRASHTRATAAALRVRRGLPPLFATPRAPKPAGHPQPVSVEEMGGGTRAAAPSSPLRRIWAQRFPGETGARGPARDAGPRGGMCSRTPCPWRPIYSRWHCPPLARPEWLSAGGTACPLSALLKEPRLICTLPFSLRNGRGGNCTQHGRRRPGDDQATWFSPALPLTPSLDDGRG